MDIEFQMQQPSFQIVDDQPIDVQLFFLKGIQTTLTLYPFYFSLENRSFSQMFTVTLQTKYQIKSLEENPQETVLAIYLDQNRILELRKFNWTHQSFQQWQASMLKVMNRNNFHDFFTPLKKIGQGNFANVYLAQRKKDKKLFAVKAFTKKQIQQTKNGKEALFNQISLLRRISCENIVTLYGVYETERSIYMVQQYAQGKNLCKILSKVNQVPINHRKTIMRGILKALVALQQMHIVHRDIKPQNIIYKGTEDSLKIVDFGLATQINLSRFIFIRCGTPGHVAPEIINLKDKQIVRFHTISDVFSAGTIFYQLIFNRNLFDGNDNVQILDRNRECDFSQTLSQQAAELVNFQQFDLLKKMLKINHEERITASQALNHSFLSQNIQFNHPLGISNKSIAVDCKVNTKMMISENAGLRRSKRLNAQNFNYK